MRFKFESEEEKMLFALTAKVGNLVKEMDRIPDPAEYMSDRLALRDKITELIKFCDEKSGERNKKPVSAYKITLDKEVN